MIFKSQINPEYKNFKIGNTNNIIARFGCLVCCLASILEIDPREIAKRGEFFNSDGTIKDTGEVARAFGGDKVSPNITRTVSPIIMQTSYDGGMHFVINNNGRIYDPLTLDGRPLRNYEPKDTGNGAWRNIKKGNEKGDEMKFDLIKKGQDYFIQLWSGAERIPDPEQARIHNLDLSQAKEVSELPPVFEKVNEDLNKCELDKNRLIKGSQDKVKEIELLKENQEKKIKWLKEENNQKIKKLEETIKELTKNQSVGNVEPSGGIFERFVKYLKDLWRKEKR